VDRPRKAVVVTATRAIGRAVPMVVRLATVHVASTATATATASARALLAQSPNAAPFTSKDASAHPTCAP
jgi:hypothetical protein